jgi:ATPase family protein associated with various cellular activities (AAA)
MARVEFQVLRAERDALRDFVRIHPKSLEAFKDGGNPWYRREEKHDQKAKKDVKVRHLTTTASCLESLAQVPVYEVDDPPPPCPSDCEEIEKARAKTTDAFAERLLGLDGDKWESENQRLVYSKVRTLPVVLQLASDGVLEPFKDKLATFLDEVWEDLKEGDLRAQGIAERSSGASSDSERYPPNAFHTYSAVRLIREYRGKQFLKRPRLELARKEAVAQLWARRTLAAQAALISAGQKTIDAHQLAWALSTDVLCRSNNGDQPTTADHQHIELYETALAAFFGEQDKGRWPLYQPLFHYAQAGNAYCYTYETLAELLRLSLVEKGGRILRDQLRDYAQELINAWHYARDTALALEKKGGLGWCSGHHPHRTHPEAWATAAVFAYLQNLRCLIGHWAAEGARAALAVRATDGGSEKDGEERLGDRGETWNRPDTETVGRQIASLFLHPLRATTHPFPAIDPDRPLVNESRSALLFGPPGTSKTSLVGGLAAALGWDYVEILASDFLRDGMDNVPKVADEIFQQVMELDHCVILFDEIDELIRMRNDDGSDPFGRFLTTSMLPKLAKLWEQRRVLFFVATNDIAAADPAIKRSQRFDAAIFVPPPSFEKKKERLRKLGHKLDGLSAGDVEASLKSPDPSNSYKAVFAFLRWDQIDDLANRLDRHGKAPDALKKALEELGRELERTDWHVPSSNGDLASKGSATDGNTVSVSKTPFEAMIKRWNEQGLDERRDHRHVAVLKLTGKRLRAKFPDGWEHYGSNEDGYVEIRTALRKHLKRRPDGVVELDAPKWKAVDGSGILSFK